MKIKRKKQLNLPQLIEWALVNEIKHKTFQSNPNFDGVTYKLGFDKAGDLYFEEPLTPTLLFTVEVEEEITEGTVIPKMLLRGRYTGYYEVEDCKLRGFNENLLQAYILNDDLTMTLIWRDGKLVE